MESSPTNQKPDSLILEFFQRVWSPPHDLDAIDELMAEDYRITNAGTIIRGREAFKTWVKEFQQLLLEAKTESVDMFFDKNETKVVSRWVCSGKNNGLFGLDPDDRPISFTGMAIWTVSQGKLTECWVERSAYELFKELVS